MAILTSAFCGILAGLALYLVPYAIALGISDAVWRSREKAQKRVNKIKGE